MVCLLPNQAFQPKVLARDFLPEPLVLESFHSLTHLSVEAERLHNQCPMRAPRIYVNNIKVSHSPDRLYVSLNEPHWADLCQITIPYTGEWISLPLLVSMQRQMTPQGLLITPPGQWLLHGGRFKVHH